MSSQIFFKILIIISFAGLMALLGFNAYHFQPYELGLLILIVCLLFLSLYCIVHNAAKSEELAMPMTPHDYV